MSGEGVRRVEEAPVQMAGGEVRRRKVRTVEMMVYSLRRERRVGVDESFGPATVMAFGEIEGEIREEIRRERKDMVLREASRPEVVVMTLYEQPYL